MRDKLCLPSTSTSLALSLMVLGSLKTGGPQEITVRIYSIIMHLLSTYYVSGSVLGSVIHYLQ